MLPNQIIILGGGSSVNYLGAIEDGLFQFLQNKFSIGINFSYKFVNTTCNLGVDENLYEGTGDHAIHQSHNVIAALPLWIGKDCTGIKHPEPNSIFLKPSKTYDRELKNGVYRASLSGIFATSLAIKLLRQGQSNTEIYLLGYDYSPCMKDGKKFILSDGKPWTHWYQDTFQHRGTGKVSWYAQTGIDPDTQKRLAYAELEFKPFVNEKEVKIFNVGGTSIIPTFPHISYEEFFSRKFDTVDDQDNLRKELRETLLKIKRDNAI